MKKSTMKSISIIIPRLDNNAPVQVAMALAKQLASNHQVFVYTIKGTLASYAGDIPVKKITVNNIIKILSSDIIHTHCFLPDLIGMIFKFLSFSKAVLFVTTVHCDPLEEFKNRKLRQFLIRLWIYALRKFDKTIVLNSHVARTLTSRGVKSNVIYNGKDVFFNDYPGVKSKILKFSGGRKIIGAYSVFKRVKGIEQLIEYAINMDSSRCIVIAGDGELMPEFKLALHSNALEHKVLILGHVNNAHNLLRYFDVYVITSRSEGFPIALIEALASGIPICHSNIPQFIEFKNNLGFISEVYELDNIVSLSNSLDACLDSDLLVNHSEHNKMVYLYGLTERSMCNSYLKYCYEIN